ncbi:MAG: hypothetical protein EXR48_06235 [Dehalococcoidia bacterium]|nr:hypothetical protein [Dehalococcoidia bacterium]
MATSQDGELVQIAYLEGEPLARLAEDWLQKEGIQCMLCPAGVGPGGWGQALGQPFTLWVRAGDEERAYEVLDTTPLPSHNGTPRSLTSTSRLVAIIALILILALILTAADRLFERLL